MKQFNFEIFLLNLNEQFKQIDIEHTGTNVNTDISRIQISP